MQVFTVRDQDHLTVGQGVAIETISSCEEEFVSTEEEEEEGNRPGVDTSPSQEM